MWHLSSIIIGVFLTPLLFGLKPTYSNTPSLYSHTLYKLGFN